MPSKTTSDATFYRNALRRAERALDRLRNYHVCEGWSVDEEGAERTLKYLRALVAGRRAVEAEEQAALAFFFQHGICLDWIYQGEPGLMICKTAAMSPRALASAPARAA